MQLGVQHALSNVLSVISDSAVTMEGGAGIAVGCYAQTVGAIAGLAESFDVGRTAGVLHAQVQGHMWRAILRVVQI